MHLFYVNKKFTHFCTSSATTNNHLPATRAAVNIKTLGLYLAITKPREMRFHPKVFYLHASLPFIITLRSTDHIEKDGELANTCDFDSLMLVVVWWIDGDPFSIRDPTHHTIRNANSHSILVVHPSDVMSSSVALWGCCAASNRVSPISTNLSNKLYIKLSSHLALLNL